MSLPPSLLPNLCSRGTRQLLCDILGGVFTRKGKNTFSLSEATAIVKHMLHHSDGAFSLRAADFAAASSICTDALISVIDQSLALGLADPIYHILEDSRREFQVDQLPVGAEPRVAKFLCNLVTELLQQQSNLNPIKLSLKAFFEAFLTKGRLREVPAYPEYTFQVSKDKIK